MTEPLPCNRDNMRAFIGALMSGEYKQGRAKLRQGEGTNDVRYCCLGVATDLAVKAGACEERAFSMYSLLPTPVVHWLGIDDINPLLNFGQENRLMATAANDDFGVDFRRIAIAFRDTYDVYDNDSEESD